LSYICLAFIRRGGEVWINSPGDDIYWNDYSYAQVSNQLQATKVSFASDDHSAITTGTTDVFISKWGPSPLFRHSKNDCPYDVTNLHYYAPVTISGPTLICSSGASFTVNNLPTGATIVWSQGPNLTRTSAQGAHPCTFSATGSGSSWIRATLVIGSDSVTLADKVIWSGPPIISYVTIDGSLTIPEQFCTEQYYIFNAAIPSAYPGIVSYSWTGDNAEILNPDINPVYINFQGVGDYGTATLHISGTCGQATGMYSVTREIINCGGGVIYSVYPNPSDNEITISIPFIESSNAKIYVTIVDISGIVLYQGYSSVGQEIKINVSQWNPGIYTAIFRNEAEINKLLFIVN
jgi:hypothetical protein